MAKEPTYTEAFEELQEIVSELERGDITVDLIADKIKRAVHLIRLCRKKLKAVEGDVGEILGELERAG